MFTLKELRHRHSFSGDQRDIDILLAESVRKDPTFLFAHPEYCLRLQEYLRFRWFIHRYQRGWSVAAVVGHKEFFGLDFFINRRVLVPRPETELMVENALLLLSTDTVLVDVGTGTGCIPVSILKTSQVCPLATFAIDISRKALRVAKNNAQRHSVKIQFLRGNLIKPSLKNYRLSTTSYRLLITANLPYLTQEQVDDEPSIQREPLTALVAPEGGLASYRELFTQVQAMKRAVPTTILCEIDPSQAERMVVLVRTIFPEATVAIKKDLVLRDRLIVISLTA